MQIEEAIEILRKDILIDDCFINHELDVIFKESTKIAIETVLNELEMAEKVIDKRNEEKLELAEMNFTKSKVIDEMAEYIVELIKYNNPEEERDKEEIKEYFYKKAQK